MDEELPVTSLLSELKTREQPEAAPIVPTTPEVTPVSPTPRKPLEVTSLKPVITGQGDFQPIVEEPVESLDEAGIVADPAKVKTIRDYMIKRKGAQYYDKTAEEVVDDFVTHMRWVNSNEISTIGEARQVFSAEDQDKAIYGEAYKVYDELGTFWDGSWSEIGEGLFDYTAATLTSPSTWIGGFVGRAAAKGATRAVQKAAIESITSAATKSLLKSRATSAIAKEAAAIAVKQSAKTVVAVSTAFDAASSSLQDYIYQNTMIEAGAQQEYNPLQGAVALLGGAVGGMVSYVPEVSRGLTQLDDVTGKITKARTLRAAKAKDVAAPEIVAAVKKLATNWDELAKSGAEIDSGKFVRDEAVDWFVDVNREDSFIRILQKAGADLDLEDGGRLSYQLADFASGMPEEFKNEMTEALQPLGLNFGEFIDVFASSVKEGGQTGNKLSIASKFWGNFQNVTVSKRNAAQNTVAGELVEKTEEELSPELLRYTASVWKRMLVSHPATTMLNVKGWSFSMAGRTMAEILHGGVLGSVGLVKKLLNSSTADATLAQSSALFKNQGFMFKTLLDPYTSVEGFTALMEKAPKKYQKQALASFFGGVGDERPAMFGLNEANLAVKGTEKLVDVAGRLSLIRTQDIYTKTFSGLKELDKQVRLAHKMSLSDLVNNGRSHEITEDMWQSTVDALLKDTYSQDYTKGKGFLNNIAALVEKASNAPGVGFIVPFGRFMNNTVAFSMAYSPLALIGILPKMFKQGVDMEIGDQLARATVGTTMLAMITVNEGEKEKRGLQWFETETDTGEVRNVQNLFPMSLYNLVGRMAHLYRSGQGIPPDLWNELTKQVGPVAAFQGLTDNKGFQEITDYLSGISGDEDAMTETMKLLGFAANTIAGTVASGFTRPLDPYNDMLGAYLDVKGVVADVNVDRKQAEGVDGILQNFGRYTNTFFSLMLGEKQEDGRVLYGKPANSATEDKSTRDPNPFAKIFGSTVEPPKTNIDLLLGQVNLPPFKANSYTAGDPEYDAFINDTVFPILELKATQLINNDYYKKQPTHAKLAMVKALIADARADVLDLVEDPNIGKPNEVLLNERRKFMKLPESMRVRAKSALKITVPDRQLTLWQLEVLRDYIDVETGVDKNFLGNL